MLAVLNLFRRSFATVALLTIAGHVYSQTMGRPPAVPLVTHDPYFSIWSMNDKLTDGPTRHWTGTEQPMTGLVRIDGTAYRIMGNEPRKVAALPQVSLQLTPTHTVYNFSGAGVDIALTFFTPVIANDLDLVSRPVTYVSWAVKASDAKTHQVSLFLDVDARVAVNTDDQEVIWGRSQAGTLKVLNVGSRDQRVLNRSGDNLRIDWGFFHLAVPEGENPVLANSSSAPREFVKSGKLPASDDMGMPKQPRDGAAKLAVAFDLENVNRTAQSRHMLLSYTEEYAIELLNRRLRPYWQRNGQTVQSMLEQAEEQYPALEAKAAKFDTDLTADMERAGGKGYAQLTVLAYRQTLAAHKLVADVDGSPAYFPKENFSNGCIATVDVLYPSAPFFLLLSPKLLEAQLKPVLDYASLARWKWPFAPHDLGQYPLANGQVYGGGERTDEDQMPVEETGNLLILVAALGKAEGNNHVAEQYWPLLSKWADYVRQKGLDPENQLSTDDFAGHLAHNANLSIKAIDGLAAYAQMARALGKTAVANDYGNAAKEMAGKWQQLAIDGDHYKLAFDKSGTWSQKYNLVWDQLLGLNIFPAKVRETEIAFYKGHLNEFGLPLDSRESYTKLDWQVWTATLADKAEDFQTLFAPIPKWVNEGPTRVPLTDWYDTKSGKMVGFQARSVVGGVYIKALADKDIAGKWQGLAR
jgi:Domain of unknown function (DUF4965)/Domain of unknown function (DUF1793)/Domain of unknown function (DUF5127)/Domain of unknown function (DUF4964)